MKKSYVPTSLDQFLSESRNITLRRQYGEKPAVVVSTRAPLRNQVLAYVMENEKVTRKELKKFIAGLNEGNKNPAATGMFLKRNEKFFVVESKDGVTTYKLSKLGEKLIQTLQPKQQEVEAISEAKEDDDAAKLVSEPKDKNEIDKIKKEKQEKVNEEEIDEACMKEEESLDKEGYTCKVDNEDEVNEESREDRINRLVEQIREKRARALEVNEEVAEVEKLVNEVIQKDIEVTREFMPYDDAIAAGAMAFFKEQYGETVSVYSVGDFSMELCGGPHVERTGILGKFKIGKQKKIGAGVMRIRAVLE